MQHDDNAGLESEIGTVLSVEHPMALVRVRGVSCARCQQGKGCGMGLMGGDQRVTDIEARIPDGLSVEPGRAVRLTFGRQELLKSAWVLYGVPLLCLLTGLGGLALLAPAAHDGAAVLAAVVSLGIGAAVSATLSRRLTCARSLTPSVALPQGIDGDTNG